MTHATALEAKVEAVNKLHMEVNRQVPLLLILFKQWLGKPVIKADGDLLTKIRKQLPPANGVDFFHKVDDFNLCFRARASVPYGGGFCSYAETRIGLGRVECCKLASLHDTNELTLNIGYTVEGVKAAQKAVDDAERALNKAHANLHPFDRYLR